MVSEELYGRKGLSEVPTKLLVFRPWIRAEEMWVPLGGTNRLRSGVSTSFPLGPRAFGLVLYLVLSCSFCHNNSPYGSPPQDQECLLPRLSWFFAWFGWLSCYCYGCLQDNCNKPLNWFSLGVPAPGYWISGTESARLRPIFAKQERGQEAAKQHSYTRRMGHGGSQPCYSGTTGRFVNNRRKQPGSVIPISKR